MTPAAHDTQGAAPSPVPGRRRGDPRLYLACFPAKPIPLETGRSYSIGRAEGNNIVLADADVSRHHAMLVWEQNVFVIKDFRSRNGTFVNGEQVENCVVQPSDEITIGERTIKILLASEQEARDLHAHHRMQQSRGKTQPLVEDASSGSDNDQRFSGSMENFGLPELIQTLELNRKTGVLTLVGDFGRGSLVLRTGEVIAAEFDEHKGAEAVYHLMTCSGGFFQFEPHETLTTEAEIQMHTHALLMEGMRRQDESRRCK